jgi:hypothetical protein
MARVFFRNPNEALIKLVLYQGTTSVVPQLHENKDRALAPEGMTNV